MFVLTLSPLRSYGGVVVMWFCAECKEEEVITSCLHRKHIWLSEMEMVAEVFSAGSCLSGTERQTADSWLSQSDRLLHCRQSAVSVVSQWLWSEEKLTLFLSTQCCMPQCRHVNMNSGAAKVESCRTCFIINLYAQSLTVLSTDIWVTNQLGDMLTGRQPTGRHVLVTNVTA